MVKRAIDPLNAASRNDVLISQEDTTRLGIKNGKSIRLTSTVGSYSGRAKIDQIKRGNLEVHWTEGNCLLFHEEIDAPSGEPDYNAIVTVEKIAEV